MQKFNDKEYDDRLDFINDYLQKALGENEEIKIRADVGWKCSGNIDIAYQCVKNKKHTSHSYYLDPRLMRDLSDITVTAICTDLLNLFRSG